MPKVGTTRAYRYYADRFYLDRANRDTYLARNAVADIEISGNLVLSALKTVDGVDIGAHAADLDAHTRNNFETFRTSEYITPFGLHSGVASAGISANSMDAIIFSVPRAMTLDGLAISVTVAGAAGTLARLGIYKADGTNLYPGTLVLDAGTVLVDATGIRAVTISQALTKGLYYLVFVSNGTPTVYYCRFVASPLGANTLFTFAYGGWRGAFTFAALPDPFPADFSLNAGLFLVMARLLSLD